MHVLIVEDSAFNAYCLRRILEDSLPMISVDVVSNSTNALALVKHKTPDLIIIDGNLGAEDGSQCNGPTLSGILLDKYPQLPLIAWTDSEQMRTLFASIFDQFNRAMSQYNTWPKVINSERVLSTFDYYFNELPHLMNCRESLTARH